MLTLPPPALALLAASIFGATMIMGKISMRRINPSVASWYSIGFSMLVFWIMTPFEFGWRDFITPWTGFFALLGLLQPFLSVMLSFEATARLGPTVSATVASTAPLFSLTGAVLILHESVTGPIVMGTVLIIMGVMVLSWHGQSRRDWAMTALLFPLGTAFIRGFSHLGTKYGLGHFPHPLLVAMISYTVAFGAGLLLYSLRSGNLPKRHSWVDVKWVAMAGIGNAMAIYCLFLAFNTGRVVVVSPIVATFPLFTLAYSKLFFREEIINRRTLAGVLLIVPGVALINFFK